MKMHGFLLAIVLGVSVVACADVGQLVSIPNPSQTESFVPQIRITPSLPTASDEVFVTVCGRKPGSDYVVCDTELRVEGSSIWLDLHWGISFNMQFEGQLLGWQVVQPVPTFQAVPYEYTESLGTLDPGVYTLHVTNLGAVSGGATMMFFVIGVPDNSDPGPSDPIGGLELPDWLTEPVTSAPDLPGFEIQHVPWSDVSDIKEGISQLSVKPFNPTSSDEVSVTITGWKPNEELAVERTTLRVEGNQIWLDLYWHTRPLLPPPPTVEDLPAVPAPPSNPGGGGINLQGQSWNLGLGNLTVVQSQPATVVQYDIEPYWGVPYEYTAPLGTLSPGIYVLHVTNHAPMSGSDSITLTVLPSADVVGQLPW